MQVCSPILPHEAAAHAFSRYMSKAAQLISQMFPLRHDFDLSDPINAHILDCRRRAIFVFRAGAILAAADSYVEAERAGRVFR